MSLLSPKAHLDAFRELISLLTRHRQLTWEMTKREIGEQYAGQILGALWAIAHPLILMGIYVFIFAYVFKAKIGGTRELPLNYTVYLLSGLVPWLTLAASMAKGSTAITANASLVKQVVFPIEILPVKVVLASFTTQTVATAALVTYVLVSHGFLFWTYLLLPGLFLIQMLGMIGINYFLSAVGAYFRDTKDIVQVLCIVGMYLMPIFYLPMWVPRMFKPVLYLNPFSYMIWCYQDACYFGRFEHPWAWGVLVVLSLGTFYCGYRIFRKAKTYFGNVL